MRCRRDHSGSNHTCDVVHGLLQVPPTPIACESAVLNTAPHGPYRDTSSLPRNLEEGDDHGWGGGGDGSEKEGRRSAWGKE